MRIHTQSQRRDRQQVSPAYFLLLLLIQFFLGAEYLHAADKAKAELIVSDVLTTPGKPAKLQANVFEEGLLGAKNRVRWGIT